MFSDSWCVWLVTVDLVVVKLQFKLVLDLILHQIEIESFIS